MLVGVNIEWTTAFFILRDPYKALHRFSTWFRSSAQELTHLHPVGARVPGLPTQVHIVKDTTAHIISLTFHSCSLHLAAIVNCSVLPRCSGPAFRIPISNVTKPWF
jgi:hypothetical protein